MILDARVLNEEVDTIMILFLSTFPKRMLAKNKLLSSDSVLVDSNGIGMNQLCTKNTFVAI